MTELFLFTIGSVEECDPKSGSAIKSTFDSMKKGSNNVVKMKQILKSSNRNIDRQRNFVFNNKAEEERNHTFYKAYR